MNKLSNKVINQITAFILSIILLDVLGKPILTTQESANYGKELRQQHAEILTQVIIKQQAKEIGEQVGGGNNAPLPKNSMVDKVKQSRQESNKQERNR